MPWALRGVSFVLDTLGTVDCGEGSLAGLSIFPPCRAVELVELRERIEHFVFRQIVAVRRVRAIFSEPDMVCVCLYCAYGPSSLDTQNRFVK